MIARIYLLHERERVGLNRERSIGSSDLLLSLALACVDSSNNGSNSSKSILGLLNLGDGNVGGVDG